MPCLWAKDPRRSLRDEAEQQGITGKSWPCMLPGVCESDICELSGDPAIGEMNLHRI